MREDIWHGAGHGTGAMAGITDGLDRLIGHNGQVCCTDNITHQQRKGLQYTKNWPHKKTVRQQLVCETAQNATRNGPFRTMKWAVLEGEMGCFRGRNGLFCNILCISILQAVINNVYHSGIYQ